MTVFEKVLRITLYNIHTKKSKSATYPVIPSLAFVFIHRGKDDPDDRISPGSPDAIIVKCIINLNLIEK